MALNYHMKRSHPPRSGLKCDSCGDTFPNLKKYSIHARSHESSRDHKCDECHALFSSNSNLNRHISEEHQIVNYNVKNITVMTYPFTCDECDFYTKRKHYLQVHKRLQHSPDSFERIPCDHCSKTFEIKSNLRRHERRYHESKMLISDILNTIVKSAMMWYIQAKLLILVPKCQIMCNNFHITCFLLFTLIITIIIYWYMAINTAVKHCF